MKALRRIAPGEEAERIAVIELGYMNSASAEPAASVMNGTIWEGARRMPAGLWVTALLAASSALALSNTTP